MLSWLIGAGAAVSTTVCLFLWFREVRRIMRERKSTVDSAGSQLASCRKKTFGVPYDPDLAEVVTRSESIYRQAVAHYDQAFHKPWIRLPALLLGFRAIPPEDYYMLGRDWEL